jgi:hypothetical protein
MIDPTSACTQLESFPELGGETSLLQQKARMLSKLEDYFDDRAASRHNHIAFRWAKSQT